MKTIILALLVLTTGCSYKDQVRDQKFYCFMVQEKHWPEYDNDINCGVKI